MKTKYLVIPRTIFDVESIPFLSDFLLSEFCNKILERFHLPLSEKYLNTESFVILQSFELNAQWIPFGFLSRKKGKLKSDLIERN